MTDPRRHPLARRVEGPRITYACACANEVDRASGVLRRVEWCPEHAAMRRDPATLGRGYYEELGCIVDGVPQCSRYIEQLCEALGEIPEWEGGEGRPLAVEVGCGASMYAPALLFAGYYYVGVDPSPWAREWTGSVYDMPTFADVDEAFKDGRPAELILCAHAFEHMDDAPGAIRRCAGLLAPGGELWAVVPDDSDPCNPDHIYFFTTDTLRACLEAAGLAVERIVTRRYVPHENFLYARASKP